MKRITSKDQTGIAFDQSGTGPAVILVGGAFNTRSFGPNESLATLLAQHFTVINYDRRGRGDSGDTKPYAVEREIEDLEALIDHAGGSIYLYGISSGAALALAAANRLSAKIRKLALYEAPFVVDNSRRPIPADFAQHLKTLIGADRHNEAIRYFMTQGVGVPAVFVFMMRFMPAWSQLKAVAHTVPYDASLLGDAGAGKPLSNSQWASVTMPTLVMDGGKSPAWMRHSMQALTAVLPNATYRTMEGQMHYVSAEAIAPPITEFFRES